MNQEEMIRFYEDDKKKIEKEQRKRTVETWICKAALLLPSIIGGGIIWCGFVSSVIVETLLMLFALGFSVSTIAFITQGEQADRQIFELKSAVLSQTIYSLKQITFSKQQLQAIENIMEQTMQDANKIVSIDLDTTTHTNQVHKLYRIYHDKIKNVIAPNKKDRVINVQETMKTNANSGEPKVSEELTETQENQKTPVNDVDPKISAQLELTELLMQKGFTLEQTVRLLSTYSKNDYSTLIALFKTDMIPLETLQDNSISLIDDRIRREYAELMENAQTKEGKQAMQKRYYQDLLNKYLESTTPDSEDNFAKKKMR